MKVQLKVGNAVIEGEGSTVKDVFKDIAGAAEVFCEPKCGMCGSESIIPHTRVVGKFEFFEHVCLACGAKLAFGQSTDTKNLFPKRYLGKDGMPADKDEGGTFDTKHKGWHKYMKPQEAPAGNQVRR